jgi:predicted MPP superfamily phosphohydrolase
MTRRRFTWRRRTQFALVHWAARPLHGTFKRLPRLEAGLARAEVSRIACLHAPLAGRRAVQISDLHLDRYHARHDHVLERIAALAPDWIFVTGDLLNTPDGLPHLFRFLGGLRSLAPVYLTLGNHDHYSGVSVSRFGDLADRHKLTLLVNHVTFAPVPGGELCVVGVDDPSTHRADLRCIPRRRPGRFTVLLAHAPNILDELDDRHATDLVLCGHSHGGQWRFSRLPLFWLPYGCNRRAAGLYERGGHRLYVNRGLGWALLPVRLNCPPEILVVDWTE